MTTINIYCDESCHLEKDGHPSMVVGAAWAKSEVRRPLSRKIIELKKKHGLKPTFDMKWVTVSPSKASFFLEIVDLFFSTNGAGFRCLVAHKDSLDHVSHHQTHDEWYYKMMYRLITPLLDRSFRYRIFLDIKDTQSISKVRKLHQILNSTNLDFESSIVEGVEQVRSHEIQLLQLGDLLIGAVMYANSGRTTSRAKLAVVERIRQKTGLSLTKSTLVSEKKFNVFHWNGTQRHG